MSPFEPPRVGYVVKRYPRFSETFIVNEILAHERAGLPVHIFAVRRTNDTHFQSFLAQVRSSVTYIPDDTPKADAFWSLIGAAKAALPELWRTLNALDEAEAGDVHQAILLALKVRELGIGHLHSHFGTITTTVTRLAARIAGVSYSFTAHAKDIFHEEVAHEAMRVKMREAAAVVTVSDFNVRWLRQSYGAAAAGVRRIYNGLDLDAFPYRRPEGRSRRILAVGRLVEKKGFDILVEACALLRARGVSFECLIIGDGRIRDSLAAQIERHALGDQVILAGPRPQPEAVEALYEAAVFAAPCVIAADGDRDGLPTVLLEAMALGTPCISTEVTGIPEVVRDGETGLLIRPGDPAALADALTRVLEDESLRMRLSEQARRLIEREFDVHRNTAVLRDVFAGAVEGRAGSLRAVG